LVEDEYSLRTSAEKEFNIGHNELLITPQGARCRPRGPQITGHLEVHPKTVQ
jgi:hypothetical protein